MRCLYLIKKQVRFGLQLLLFLNLFLFSFPSFAAVLLLDDFESGMSNWTVVGEGSAGTGIHTAQSPTRSLFLSGRAVVVESTASIDLSSGAAVNISMWIRRGSDSFSEDPDSDEDLIVSYLDNSGSWSQLERFAGNGTPGQIYVRNYPLPDDALHDNFRLRIRILGGSPGYDYWHVDDVLIETDDPSVASMILASPDPTKSNTTVEWNVEFSEAVTGVDLNDFVLIESGGAASSSLISVTGNGTRWVVSADSGSSDTGTLGLSLADDDTIINAGGAPLGGIGSGNGDVVGPVYTLKAPAPILSKIASTTAATVNGVVTFTIAASNPYSEPLTDIVITDILPAGMTYVTHLAPDGDVVVAGQNITWTLDSIAAGSLSQITLVVSLTQQGTLINTVTAPDADPASATVLVLGSAVTHFRMDEPVGSWTGAAGEIIDSGGTTLHGRRLVSSPPTATNAVDPSPSISSQHSSVVGGFCNTGSFDGGGIVQVAASDLFDYTTQLSASAWIYPTAYPSSGNIYSILSNDVNYEFHLNSSGQLYWWWQASTLTSSRVIPLNQWTHIVITFDSSPGISRQRIYINGVLDSNGNNWQGTLSQNECNFYIGGDVATGSCAIRGERNFRGLIDEVKLYSFELSQAEVLADMRLGRSCSGTFDHIRIEHDGSASICTPESVTVKACMDSSCSSLYPGQVTVNLLPSGWLGGGTFSFSGGIASRQLGVGSPGDVVLGVNSVSPTSSSSARCFNGSTETCTLNFANASCAFDAVEPGEEPQTRLFTKLAGVPFNVDVLALLDPTTINTAYQGSVSVDLVDTSNAVCPAGNGLIPATDFSYTLGWRA